MGIEPKLPDPACCCSSSNLECVFERVSRDGIGIDPERQYGNQYGKKVR
jgi:hypothetical protein